MVFSVSILLDSTRGRDVTGKSWRLENPWNGNARIIQPDRLVHIFHKWIFGLIQLLQSPRFGEVDLTNLKRLGLGPIFQTHLID